MHTANEALARALAVAGDSAKARKHLAIARSQLGRLTLGKEERGVYLQQLEETESLIK